MGRQDPRHAAEQGAMLIQVTIALLAAISMSAWVFDYGVFWVTRTQIQTAADAGALAGATSLAFDSATDTDLARGVAIATTGRNPVWDGAAEVEAGDVAIATCGSLAPGSPNPAASCVQVDAYRGALDRSGQGVRGQALPAFFATIFGVMSQGVRGTAVAQVAPSDSTTCLRPWSVPDRWQENQTGPFSTDDTFDKYAGKSGKKGGGLLPNADVYAPADAQTGTGTGYTVADVGLSMVLKEGSPHNAVAPGWYNAVVLPRADGKGKGGSNYRDNIESCNSLPVEIGDWLTVEPGNMVGPTKQGVNALIAQDPTATWNTTTKQVQGSAYAKSPRVVAIALYNPAIYEDGKQNGRTEILVTNIVGFFIDRMSGNDVVGYLTLYPGDATGTVNLPGDSAFLRSVAMVR